MTARSTWPADRFYWAVIEAPGVEREGELPAGLLPYLADQVPVDVSQLHAVCVPIERGSLAVCAAKRAALTDLPVGVTHLTPQSIPGFIEGAADPAGFNLLAGRFEPRPIRRARFTRHAVATATLLLCTFLIAVGLHRRQAHWAARAASARDAASRLSLAVSPDAADLATEADRLAGAKAALAVAAPSPDASLALASVLRAWPASVASKPQSISVNPTGVSISVTVEGDATAFLESFSCPPGWTLDEPRLNAVDKITRLALQLRPKEAPR